ncbi:MAG: sterol desaturase family protein, partial [Gammaproteobacteria bacterium]
QEVRAKRIEALGAVVHLVDTILFTTISSLVFFPLLGLTVEAGVIGAFFLTFNAMFQHMSFSTPQWLGYLIQRPESHSIHHGKGIHRYNYSDLPLWDIVFGTFRNPVGFQSEHGFYPGASARIGAMLLSRDVTVPPDTKYRDQEAGQDDDQRLAA